MLPIKNDAFLWKKTGQVSNLKFFKIPLFEWFKYRNVEHWPTDFLMKNTKFCHCLIAWLFCLDEFDKFASQFYLQIFVI